MENVKKVVVKLERRLNTEVRRQEKLNLAKERDFRREKLLKKYIAKLLFRYDNRKFKDKYLRKLKRNWKK